MHAGGCSVGWTWIVLDHCWNAGRRTSELALHVVVQHITTSFLLCMRLESSELDAHRITLAGLYAGGVRHLVAHQPVAFGISVRLNALWRVWVKQMITIPSTVNLDS
jgi:hypothetical protein